MTQQTLETQNQAGTKLEQATQCFNLFEACYSQIDKCKREIANRKLPSKDEVIIIAQINDKNGRIVGLEISEVDKCSDCDDAVIGITLKAHALEILHDVNLKAKYKLEDCDGLAIVVIGYDTAKVFKD